MSSRLNEHSIKVIHDGGLKNLPWSPPKASGLLAGLDFEKILAEKNAKKIIRNLPAQTLYAAITAKGLGESLPILALISKEQFTRILDYDVWQDDALITGRFYAWLMAFFAISKEELATRFIDIEEEYQLALLVGKIKVYSYEEYEDLPQDVQDEVFAMPCYKVFYRVLSPYEQEIQAIVNLIESLVTVNMKYAYSVINHAGMMPPNESEELIKQFRRARLEEDGFVTYEESLSIFNTLDLGALFNKWQGSEYSATLKSSRQLLNKDDADQNFLFQVLQVLYEDGVSVDEQYRIHQGFLHLANSLGSSSRLEPSDVQGLNLVLEQIRALVSLGLEFLAESNLQLGAKILTNEYAKVLFQTGISLVDGLRQQFLTRSLELNLPHFKPLVHLNRAHKNSATIEHIDQNLTEFLGVPMTEVIKGLFNRFPMCPQVFTEEQASRIRFVPVDSLKMLRELRAHAEAIVALLSMLDANELKMKSIDRPLATVLLNGLLLGEFNGSPIDDKMIKVFCKLGQTELDQKLAKFSDIAIGQLQSTKEKWELSKGFGAVEPSLNVASHFISDILFSLLMARTNAESSVRLLVICHEGEV